MHFKTALLAVVAVAALLAAAVVSVPSTAQRTSETLIFKSRGP
jgi:hypothetical protein